MAPLSRIQTRIRAHAYLPSVFDLRPGHPSMVEEVPIDYEVSRSRERHEFESQTRIRIARTVHTAVSALTS